jgi:ribonuclease D
MTVVSTVKTTLVSLKGAQANLSNFAHNTTDEEAKRVFHECMMDLDSIILDLKDRISKLEFEEPQYKGL